MRRDYQAELTEAQDNKDLQQLRGILQSLIHDTNTSIKDKNYYEFQLTRVDELVQQFITIAKKTQVRLLPKVKANRTV